MSYRDYEKPQVYARGLRDTIVPTIALLPVQASRNKWTRMLEVCKGKTIQKSWAFFSPEELIIIDEKPGPNQGILLLDISTSTSQEQGLVQV